VVVNLVAVPEFSLEPHRWCYPVLGCQAYRGYFSLEAARAEEAQFLDNGFDTFIGGVTAYSTLGWFDDPLHTGFTRLTEERMVALMFHELAHRVVYIADDTAFNESFATAVELEGLRLWLSEQDKPGQFQDALGRLARRNQTLTLVEGFSARLETLFAQRDRLSVRQLRNRKTAIYADLALAYQELSADWPEPGPFGPIPVSLNNANLALFRQYNQHVPAFRQMLRNSDYDFASFYTAVEVLSEKPEPERSEHLAALSERFEEHF
jgi:predicted aminopeptidase